MNNKNILLFTAGFLLFISRATKLIVYGFQSNAEESSAYNTGLFTGKTLMLIYFTILINLLYKKYLYLKRHNIK
ncbi:hypothetical protein DSC47_08005 [Elizabethkingia miricola]|nr:hypothetical protein BAY13_19810 [Elizabethkingia bruuniana]RBI91255.1 hypothetical protein DSC47_08005 [Elizabethkingia miricola]